MENRRTAGKARVLGKVVLLLVVAGVLAHGSAQAVLLRVSAQGGCTDIAGSIGWVPTGIIVPAAATALSLGVEGTIDVGAQAVAPGGSGPAPAGGGFCAPALAPHSAIGCIGGGCTTGSGLIFAIGVGAADLPGILAPAAGELFLGVNDDFYVDNQADWNAAVGPSPNIAQLYLITGVSNGVGWTLELTNPGAVPVGEFSVTDPGIAAGLGPAGFVAAFVADIPMLSLPNVTAAPGAAPGALAIFAPGPFNLWLTAPGAVGLPTGNADTMPVAFNPLIQAVTTQAIPTLSTWGLLLLILLMAVAAVTLMVRREARSR